MHKPIRFLFFLVTLTVLSNCNSEEKNKKQVPVKPTSEESTKKTNLLTDITPIFKDGDVNAVIEIPAGTVDKWELDKTTGEVTWEMVNNTPKVVNYLGYPGNYGMIPRTLLDKENGGDGDPLDILVLGPPVERGSLLKSKIIGVLYLSDGGEQDDKLIAVSSHSALYQVNSIEELNNEFQGITTIIDIWFTNYKGPGKLKSNGFGDKAEATRILNVAMNQYKAKE
ncbi:inorganic diphosphatase [Tamlana sp. 2_MG-2023]|uniref:inorganic diphosphatase n=1 Tax=unclassified Tamlana TaxID=2614803 RepID=UPI0026E1AABD|nr:MULTISPECIES: inorganic diphosphatase [unclassified Tamlana]MDO6760803.1 inorganic diphosphatase [Tamlana sp. 2_MG-2023]MDO6791059.1 inorganic diphosphatase [Tamlana sp. 1_MG-2023]